MAMRRSVLGPVLGVVVTAGVGVLAVTVVWARFGTSVPFLAALVAAVFLGLAGAGVLGIARSGSGPRPRRRRFSAVYSVAAVLSLAVTAVSWVGIPRVVPGTEAITTAVDRALLVRGSIGVPPIATGGGYALAGTRGRAALQPALSDNSAPWRWGTPGCDAIDASHRSAMTAYLTTQAHDAFTGRALALAVSGILPAFWFTARPCGHVATGPPAAVVYRQCRFRSVWAMGNHASATAQCVLRTWEAGVSHQVTPDDGRRLDWATVSNIVDIHDTLVRGRSGRWLVDGHTEGFASGSGP